MTTGNEGTGRVRQDSLPDRPADPGRRRIGRRWLVNALNRANFLDERVELVFQHQSNGSTVSVPARPEPCMGGSLSCSWIRRPVIADAPALWRLLHVHLTDGLAQIEIPAGDVAWSDGGVSLPLPDAAVDVTTRRSKRHACRGVRALVDLGGAILDGRLESSSAASFSVLVGTAVPPPRPGESLAVELTRGKTTLFSGFCSVVRGASERSRLTLVLKPPAGAPAQERSKRCRCLRPRIAPLPLIVFRHPLSGSQVTLRAIDVSGAGFSVEEEASRAQLLPGLLLPRVRIEVTSGFEFPCSARVVYNEPTADGGLRSGLAIETMSLRDHTRLTALLHLGEYRNSSVCTPHVDLEELWSFFFETGFIYPEKYAHIKDQKAHFMRLYRNLYTRAPRIARHIIYQERGAIHGHVSMFRWFPATWILHHHAALTSSRHKAGLVVMEQMLRYINEFHRLFPGLIRYICCYFRPNNRFAGRTFGDASRSLGDRRRSSLDSFAYFHLPIATAPAALPPGWTLIDAEASDLRALHDAYERSGGGLLIEGLALRAEDRGHEVALSSEYTRLGFRRDRRLYALRRAGFCASLIAVNLSDVGLNLSDLTNGLQAFVLEPELLPSSVLTTALASLAVAYAPGSANVLLYPRSYADTSAIAYDKVYDLGVLDLKHLGPYIRYIEELIEPSRTALAVKAGE